MTELIFGSFIAGLLLTFTPCVLPMVPIISGIIVGQGENLTTKKAVMLSLAYVLGTALTYTIMGALAGATGEQLQSYFQNVWVIGGMSLVFVFMALSMFGLFTVQLPSFIQSKLNSQSNGIKGGSLPMVFLLGMISALILGACVSPVLISFLGVAIAKGDALLGGLMMFSMAMGMGIPLIILGFGAGKLLPKAGMWMDKVKYIFGILLMVVAIQLFSTLHLVSELLLWGIFIIFLAVYFGVFEMVKENDNFQKFLKALAVVLLIWGTILLVGAAKGNESFLTPLEEPINNIKILSNAQVPLKKNDSFTNIHNMRELEAKQKEAIEANKPLLIYFYTEYCSLCNKLKTTTFKDRDVIKTLSENYVAVKLNMTDKSNEAMAEVKFEFDIFGTPAFVIFNSEGERVAEEPIYGYQEPEEFYDTLDLFLD
ncbi:MAG: Cytochrome c-type biogenesis protein DsbD, protein-disulfide reductase (EC [uncultured Sulfurovum sp.]|uniref:Cytochrome c-type biogenesis protein DsbD, protein-disulfide reductase (EC) n=1 Tax=uncultured Sulfurovum sp. TaxID=269237 RepID=A0A6S6SZW6_9BACT|nr:MAG: Cytochrome c-type biogenesis protein DsbD, protein-disulfide reductase (EC [uncultured Sulfurovum sp.]